MYSSTLPATLVSGRDQGKKRRGRLAVVGPDPELVNNQDLRGQVDPRSPVQPVFRLGAAQVFQQVVGPDKVDPVALFNRPAPQGHCQMGFAHSGWAKDNNYKSQLHWLYARILYLPLLVALKFLHPKHTNTVRTLKRASAGQRERLRNRKKAGWGQTRQHITLSYLSLFLLQS